MLSPLFAPSHLLISRSSSELGGNGASTPLPLKRAQTLPVPQSHSLALSHSLSSSPSKAGRGETLPLVPMDELLGKEGTVALISLCDLPKEFPARQLFAEGKKRK